MSDSTTTISLDNAATTPLVPEVREAMLPLLDGWNRMPDGERFFFVSNPALGLRGTRFPLDENPPSRGSRTCRETS